MDNKTRSLESFKKNNPHLFNGNENIQITGNGNTINKTTNIYTPQKVKTTTEDHQYDINIHISTAQQSTIREFVNDIAEMMKDCDGKNYYMLVFGLLKKRFQIPKYSLLPIKAYEEALNYLKKQKNIFRKQLKNCNSQKFKDVTIPLIKIKWKYLNKEDEALLIFASEKLKKSVRNLDKLSVNDIDTLYTRVHSIKQKRFIN